MARMRTIRLALLVFGMSIVSFAQNSSQSQPDTTPVPAPAFGQSAPVLNPENPPVTGLDEPSLNLRTSSRSFISPALQVSESADTNGGNLLGYNGPEAVTNLLGALDLQQFWPKSDLFLEYLGGGSFYSNPSDVRQLQAAGLEAVTRWRTGQVTLRDSFSYLPDGSFEIGTLGGAPGFGIANGSGTGMPGGGLPGAHPVALFSIGNTPRLANTAILDVVQAISPVAALTVAGGFSNAHYFDPTGILINSDQLTIEGGYSRLLNLHDQIGLIYAFQLFQFPQFTGGQIYLDIVNVRWSHTITGRLSLVAGAGPQYIEMEQGGYITHWSLSAKVQLRYKVGRGSMVAVYQKYTSTGSGFYAGANSQTASLEYQRPLGRTWEFYGDLGYSHDTQLQGAPAGLGVGAGSYNDGFGSVIFRKHLGRSYEFLASYRFGEAAFSADLNPALGLGTGRTSQRQVGGIGLEWHPHPTRIE